MILSVLLILQVRADARAYLWHCGEYDFDSASKPLLDYARRCHIDNAVACSIINSAFAEYSE